MTDHKKQKQRKPAGRGALVLIAGLFLASGLLRLGSGTGEAIAKGVEALAEGKAPPERAQSCQPSKGIADLLVAVQRREEKVSTEEARIRDRMQVLAVAEAEIKRNLAALTAAEEKLKKTISLADSASEDDLARLTAVYENMKPKAAAALFGAMEPEFSAGFLGRMRPEAAAAIMAGLDPKKAYTISVILAGRNAGVPSK